MNKLTLPLLLISTLLCPVKAWADTWEIKPNPDPFSDGGEVLWGLVSTQTLQAELTITCEESASLFSDASEPALAFRVLAYDHQGLGRAFKTRVSQNILEDYALRTDFKYRFSTGKIGDHSVTVRDYANEIRIRIALSGFEVESFEVALPILFGFEFTDGRDTIEIPKTDSVSTFFSSCSDGSD